MSGNEQLLNASHEHMHAAAFDCCVQADVNVSLTSISLLWNASDLLGKLYSKAPSSSSRSSLELEPVPNGNSGPPGAQLDSEQYQELVRLLYGALQVGHLQSSHVALITSMMMMMLQLFVTSRNSNNTKDGNKVDYDQSNDSGVSGSQSQ